MDASIVSSSASGAVITVPNSTVFSVSSDAIIMADGVEMKNSPAVIAIPALDVGTAVSVSSASQWGIHLTMDESIDEGSANSRQSPDEHTHTEETT